VAERSPLRVPTALNDSLTKCHSGQGGKANPATIDDSFDLLDDYYE
jgi:hypothetical protein